MDATNTIPPTFNAGTLRREFPTSRTAFVATPAGLEKEKVGEVMIDSASLR
jgi:hypothetical protein